jgi:hypothetical protein
MGFSPVLPLVRKRSGQLIVVEREWVEFRDAFFKGLF